LVENAEITKRRKLNRQKGFPRRWWNLSTQEWMTAWGGDKPLAMVLQGEKGKKGGFSQGVVFIWSHADASCFSNHVEDRLRHAWAEGFGGRKVVSNKGKGEFHMFKN